MSALATAVFVVTLVYLIYHFIVQFFSKKIKPNQISRFTEVLVNRLAGFLLFGIVAWVGIRYLGMPTIDYNNNSFIILIVLSIIILVINYIVAPTVGNLSMYPQMRLEKWNAKTILISSFTWVLYLIGYEWMLRGFLFLSCLAYTDLSTAILINISIYALIHIPKGAKESFGSLFMGVILCGLVYKTGSVWTAVFLHSLLALSNEWFSIYFSLKNKTTC